jgi:hypothetical protein
MFDKEVFGNYSKPWIIAFVRDRFNTEDKRIRTLNQKTFRLIWSLKHTVHEDYNVGFVDTMDNGELLWETFDLEVLPSFRMIMNDTVYMVPDPKGGRMPGTMDLLAFADYGYKRPDTLTHKLRRRVDPSELWLEYMSKFVARE